MKNIYKLLETKNSITIGRIQSCDIVIKDDSVSRVHCQITRIGFNKYQIKDLNSTNGTHVNNHPIDQKIININDFITIGKHLFYIGAPTPQTSTRVLSKSITNPQINTDNSSEDRKSSMNIQSIVKKPKSKKYLKVTGLLAFIFSLAIFVTLLNTNKNKFTIFEITNQSTDLGMIVINQTDSNLLALFGEKDEKGLLTSVVNAKFTSMTQPKTWMNIDLGYDWLPSRYTFSNGIQINLSNYNYEKSTVDISTTYKKQKTKTITKQLKLPQLNMLADFLSNPVQKKTVDEASLGLITVRDILNQISDALGDDDSTLESRNILGSLKCQTGISLTNESEILPYLTTLKLLPLISGNANYQIFEIILSSYDNSPPVSIENINTIVDISTKGFSSTVRDYSRNFFLSKLFKPKFCHDFVELDSKQFRCSKTECIVNMAKKLHKEKLKNCKNYFIPGIQHTRVVVYRPCTPWREPWIRISKVSPNVLKYNSQTGGPGSGGLFEYSGASEGEGIGDVFVEYYAPKGNAKVIVLEAGGDFNTRIISSTGVLGGTEIFQVRNLSWGGCSKDNINYINAYLHSTTNTMSVFGPGPIAKSPYKDSNSKVTLLGSKNSNKNALLNGIGCTISHVKQKGDKILGL